MPCGPCQIPLAAILLLLHYQKGLGAWHKCLSLPQLPKMLLRPQSYLERDPYNA